MFCSKLMGFKVTKMKLTLPWKHSIIPASLMIFGILCLTSWSYLYDFAIKKYSILTPGSISYEIWKKSVIPLPMDIYYFNWTNPDDIYNSSIKPKFKQVGPYRFNEVKEKTNVVWHKNGTVSFRLKRLFKFDRENSVGPTTDQITTIDPVAVSAAYTARNWNFFMKKGVAIALKSMSTKIHITKTIGEFLFEGYDDHLMKAAQHMPFLADIKMPPLDKFAWFRERNNSDNIDGHFLMETGINDYMGKLYKWNFNSQTNYFNDKCNDVDGSAGEFFPPNLSKTGILKFFSSELCRPIELEFEGEEDVHGILGYRYSAGDQFLDNGTKIPEKNCYNFGEDSLPYGLINVSSCRYGSPSFASLPHFYKADEYYLDKLEGLSPERKKHELYMIFEPKTALPLKVKARLQLNLLLQPDHVISLYYDVPKIYFPIFWFEQSAEIPKDKAVLVRILLNLQLICSTIGTIFILAGLVIYLYRCFKVPSRKHYEKCAVIESQEKVPIDVKMYKS